MFQRKYVFKYVQSWKYSEYVPKLLLNQKILKYIK